MKMLVNRKGSSSRPKPAKQSKPESAPDPLTRGRAGLTWRVPDGTQIRWNGSLQFALW